MNARRHRHKTIAHVLASVALCVALGGCSTLAYYAQLASGEMAVLHARKPIAQPGSPTTRTDRAFIDEVIATAKVLADAALVAYKPEGSQTVM